LNRVVVTGLGTVSPVGLDTPSYWSALKEGKSGIGPPTAVSPDLLQGEVVAEINDFVPGRHFTDRELQPLDRVSQLAIVAAREAIAHAGITFTDEIADRTATIVGTGIGGVLTQDEGFHRLYKEGATRLYPLTVPKLMPNAPASQVTMHCGLRGPSFGVVSACSSATHAIGLAFQMVRAGIAPVAVAGGAEAVIALSVLKSWEAMRVMSNDTCRPFSRDRRGLVLAEGSAMLVMETLNNATARGAEILGESVGFGVSSEARDLTNPDVGGMSRAIKSTLADAGLNPGDVDYINAHGTGTLANDRAETAALRVCFGDHLKTLPASSTKSMIGHALGAAGALEFVATMMALQDNVAPPTMNYLGPDPECDIDCVPNEARPLAIDVALSNSFAFGGMNAVLAVKRFA
jgi:nodulation protein E